MTRLLGLALLGCLAGAVFAPAVVYAGLVLNLKGIATAYAGIRQDAAFYRAWACLGGSIGGIWAVAMQVMDAQGIEDPWYALVLIGSAMLLFWPMLRFLKRHRAGNGPRP